MAEPVSSRALKSRPFWYSVAVTVTILSDTLYAVATAISAAFSTCSAVPVLSKSKEAPTEKSGLSVEVVVCPVVMLVMLALVMVPVVRVVLLDLVTVLVMVVEVKVVVLVLLSVGMVLLLSAVTVAKNNIMIGTRSVTMT